MTATRRITFHNQIALITYTFSDGKCRAHDTASLRAVTGVFQAVAATAVECVT